MSSYHKERIANNDDDDEESSFDFKSKRSTRRGRGQNEVRDPLGQKISIASVVYMYILCSLAVSSAQCFTRSVVSADT